MTIRPDHDPRIDAAIDAVARNMTEGAPASDFNARVLARIRERRPGWRSPWVLPPLAAAAVLLLVLALDHARLAIRPDTGRTGAPADLSGRSGGGQSPAPQSPPAGAAAPAQEPGQHEQASDRPPAPRFAPGRRPAPHGGGRGKPDSRPTSAPADAPAIASDVGVLAPAALDVESIAVDGLARPESIVLQRLEISSIALTPIGEGDRP
jgi:hypothetical protein